MKHAKLSAKNFFFIYVAIVYVAVVAVTTLDAHAAEQTIRFFPVVSMSDSGLYSGAGSLDKSSPGRRLRLSDLTRPVADPDLQKMFDTTILYAYQPGQSTATQVFIRRVDAIAAFYREYPQMRGRLAFLGPETILVRMPTRQLSERAIVETAITCLRKKVARGGVEYREIAFERVGKITLPRVHKSAGSKTVSLSARCEQARSLSSRERVWIDVSVSGDLLESVPVWLRVSGQRLVWVLTGAVKQRTHLSPTNLTRRYVDLKRVPSEPFIGNLFERHADAELSISKSAISKPALLFTRDLNGGEVLTVEMLKPVPAVERGSLVNVSALAGSVIIEAAALAMIDAEMGEMVRLKSLSSKEEFRAEVIGRSMAKVVVNRKYGSGLR